MAHLRKSWLRGDEDELSILIPGHPQKCTLGGEPGQSTGEPCHRCRRADGFYQTDRRRESERVIPVGNSELRSFLLSYFNLHDQICSPQWVWGKIKTIAKRANINHNIGPENLRHTYGAILARKGFSVPIIRDVMGYPDSYEGMRRARRYIEHVDSRKNPPYHCDAQTSRGTCGREVVHPKGRCYVHEGSLHICGAEKINGATCRWPVVNSDSRCAIHKGTKCGAETLFNGPCSRRVVDDDEFCFMHR